MSCTGKSRVRVKPPRLSKQELADLARRDALVLEHLQWARGIAAHLVRSLPTWFTVEDLTGPAEIGLIKAAARYDVSSGVPFRAYAQARVYGACIDSVRRREYRERAHQSLDADGPVEMPAYENLRDQQASPEEAACAAELAAVWEHVRRLPRRHRMVIVSVYRGGMTLADLARREEVSASRLSQIHREALEMLKETCRNLHQAA